MSVSANQTEATEPEDSKAHGIADQSSNESWTIEVAGRDSDERCARTPQRFVPIQVSQSLLWQLRR